jgi:glycosyltransferase involved in cell wall biosynthesis
MMKGVIPGIDTGDFVLLWAGGLYDWFDPLTLIHAVARAAETRPEVKLFFLGVKHPHPNVPEMSIVSESRALARSLGLEGKNVFFNDSWVPFAKRGGFLLEADVGVSTHFQHLETTFSFRTRILDYIWAGLPILTTAGDTFADLVGEKSLGKVVLEKDVVGLASAILEMADDSIQLASNSRAVRTIQHDFYWEKTLQPLIDFCDNPMTAPDRRTNFSGHRRLPSPIPGLKRNIISRFLNLLDRTAFYLRTSGVRGVIGKVAERRNR